MATENAVRIGINMTPEDRRVLRKVKAQLKPEHGKMTTTAVFRMALRKLSQ